MSEKLALITGTTSGIGRALAAELLERGWAVVGIARRDGQLHHPGYRHLRLDLSDPHSLAASVQTELATPLRDASLQRVGLVNNAATAAPLGPLEHADPGALMSAYALNVVTPAWLMGYFCRTCRPGISLRIVNLSSGAAVHPVPGLGPYCGAKAALRMTGMVLAAESDARNAPSPGTSRPTILSFEPGVVDTEMQKYARSRPTEEFPWVDTFQDFARSGQLVAPARVAQEFARFLEGDGHRGFIERRFSQ